MGGCAAKERKSEPAKEISISKSVPTEVRNQRPAVEERPVSRPQKLQRPNCCCSPACPKFQENRCQACSSGAVLPPQVKIIDQLPRGHQPAASKSKQNRCGPTCVCRSRGSGDAICMRSGDGCIKTKQDLLHSVCSMMQHMEWSRHNFKLCNQRTQRHKNCPKIANGRRRRRRRVIQPNRQLRKATGARLIYTTKRVPSLPPDRYLMSSTYSTSSSLTFGEGSKSDASYLHRNYNDATTAASNITDTTATAAANY